MTKLTDIWRHPIKSLGRERLANVALETGSAMPFDRRWAINHEASKFDQTAPTWVSCANFIRGAKVPGLMAIEASIDETSHIVSLTHPDLPAIAVNPDDPADAAKLIDWIAPLVPKDRAAPTGLAHTPKSAFTDHADQTVTIANHASLRSMSDTLGINLDPRRFRINLWLDDGLTPWEEFNWVGQRVQIGDAAFEVVDRVERCRATEANPNTGVIDFPTQKAMIEAFGHKDFGVHAVVKSSGTIAIGDQMSL